MIRTLFIVAFLSVSGCQPYMDEPTKIVWVDTFKEHDYYPPDIVFVTGEPCSKDGVLVIVGKDGACYDGIYDPDYNAIYVVKRSKHSLEAFSHELFHAYLALNNKGNGDAHHANPLWNTIIPEANNNLSLRGY